MKAYFISGLGADHRVFKYISLPEGFEVIYINWLTPLRNESLRDYAMRMAAKMDMSEPYIIIGLSMGGMIASEISRNYKPKCTVLISSVPAALHLPKYMRASAKFKLYDWIPIGLLKSGTIIKRLFSVQSNEDREMLKQMVDECDASFIHWGMAAISTWTTADLNFNYVHIHGTRDRLLPIQHTKPTHIVLRGGHFMIMNRAKEINEILGNLLSSI